MKKKVFSAILAVLMAAGSLAGCGSNATSSSSKAAGGSEASSASSEAAVDTSKEVTLKMYLLGDKSTDFDKVYEKINEEMKAKINATVEVSFLSWAEHDTKYSLLFSSGEDFDLIFTASGWAHYETTVAKKGFYELTDDFLNTYAPDIMKVVPDGAWKQAKVNGKVFMVPNYNNEYGYNLVAVRGDLMEKYGITDITSPAELEAYYDKIVENESKISPLGTQGIALQYPYLINGRGRNVVGGTPLPLFTYEYANPKNTEIEYIVDTDAFKEYAHKMKEMQDKGYWSKDALSTKDTRSDNFVAGKAASMVWNLGSCSMYAQLVNKDHPEWKATFVDIYPDLQKQANPYINNGMAINAMSKNPERAMMAINQFMTNKTIYDLAAYGIEGTHYKAEGDKQYTTLPDTKLYPVNGNCNWGWNNLTLTRTPFSDGSDAVITKELATTASWNANPAEIHPLSTFTFNEENVKAQTAVITTLITQYMNPICTGLVDDVDKSIEELKQKLKEAGIEEVYKEVQAQAKTYLEENK